MSGIGEAVGDVAQGGLLARAVEPGHGEAVDGHTHETACLNCGTALIGPHCHACGQAAHVHRSLGAFFHDLLHGVLHFEGKIWRTLPMLAWRPGQLTRGYIEGQRARYVSPIALFLFVVFVTFALFSLLGDTIRIDPQVRPAAEQEFARVESETAAQIVELERDRSAAVAAGRSTASLDQRIAALHEGGALLRKVQAGGAPVTLSADSGAGARNLVAAVDAAWRQAKQNPQLLIYKLQSNAYKYSWLLIPISVPLLWLLFPFSRRFHLYDHTVFVTYSISFMLILIALSSLGAFWNAAALVIVPMLYAPFHMYRQLRGAYALSRGGALWRTAALLVFSALAVTIFAAILIALVIE